ncbi:MAG TPA: hypothetical protein VMB25_20210 [Bryobacteraceae bacterium]|nr:hypothetical protein [Bryobacteraceae bacterium]
MNSLPHQVALVSDTTSVSFSDVSVVAAALQKQASRDFGPIWQVNATVNAFESLESVPVDYWPVILRDDIDSPGAAGFHTDDNGQPFSLVQADDTWPITASHETLEMLADPFGNRTIAGAPPPQASGAAAGLHRVLYLVEVCDPCEDGRFGYGVNGQHLSDFITPHYYDPNGSAGIQYSFRGSITAPHTVQEAGYVSFGNPVNNHWFQVIVSGGKAEMRNLGALNRNGRSLRETIDDQVRNIRRKDHYRTRKPLAAKAARASSAMAESSGARAKALRGFIEKL